jgi:hypothetical protein
VVVVGFVGERGQVELAGELAVGDDLVAVWATVLITTVLITERGEGGQLGFEPLIDLVVDLVALDGALDGVAGGQVGVVDPGGELRAGPAATSAR